MKITYSQLIRTINEQPSQVLHLGRKETGWPAKEYIDNGVRHIIWVETNKAAKLADLYNSTCRFLVSQQHICENFTDKDVEGQSARFDTFYNNNRAMLAIEYLDIVVLTTGGTEFEALSGFGDLWNKYPNLKYIYVDNDDSRIAECLAPYGFTGLLSSNGAMLYKRG